MAVPHAALSNRLIFLKVGDQHLTPRRHQQQEHKSRAFTPRTAVWSGGAKVVNVRSFLKRRDW